MASTKATKPDSTEWFSERSKDIIFYVSFIVPSFLAVLGLAVTTINLFTNWF